MDEKKTGFMFEFAQLKEKVTGQRYYLRNEYHTVISCHSVNIYFLDVHDKRLSTLHFLM
jgi:hypothetical protein